MFENRFRISEIYMFLLLHCQSVSGTGIKTSPFQETDIMPHLILLLITDYISGKKISLIFFRQFLPSIFSFTIMTYLKKLSGVKYFNTKQCPPRFSHRIIPSLPASHKVYSHSYQQTAKLSVFDQPQLQLSHFTKGMGVGVLFFKKIEG